MIVLKSSHIFQNGLLGASKMGVESRRFVVVMCPQLYQSKRVNQ